MLHTFHGSKNSKLRRTATARQTADLFAQHALSIAECCCASEILFQIQNHCPFRSLQLPRAQLGWRRRILSKPSVDTGLGAKFPWYDQQPSWPLDQRDVVNRWLVVAIIQETCAWFAHRSNSKLCHVTAYLTEKVFFLNPEQILKGLGWLHGEAWKELYTCLSSQQQSDCWSVNSNDLMVCKCLQRTRTKIMACGFADTNPVSTDTNILFLISAP